MTWRSRAPNAAAAAHVLPTHAMRALAGARHAPAGAPARCCGGVKARHSALRSPLLRAPRLPARARVVAAASAGGEGGAADAPGAQLQDANWVQTALNEAIMQEDYARAAQCAPTAALMRHTLRVGVAPGVRNTR
jgi:hypothetical protein